MLIYFLCTAILVGINFFLIVALASYHALDHSSFFYSTNNVVTYNCAGKIGASVASWILYTVGGVASVWFVLFLFFVLYILWAKKSWVFEWERLCAGLIAFFALSALTTYYNQDIIWSGKPGGMVGFLLVSCFSVYGHTFLCGVFFSTLLFCSLIILERFWLAILIKKTFMVMHNLGMNVFLYRLLTKGYVVFANGLKLCYGALCFVKEQYIIWKKGQSIIAQKRITCAHVLKDYLDDISSIKQKASLFEEETRHISSMQYVPDESDICQTIDQGIKKIYQLPSFNVPQKKINEQKARIAEQERKILLLEEKLKHFGISGSIVSVKSGPVVTVFEYQPAIDTKLSKILSLEDDLALALSALSVRIIAPIPGTSVVGFEVANTKRDEVLFSSLATGKEYQSFVGHLPILLGENTVGSMVIVDLARMPHLLVAGSTGSGKSVALNAMLISLLCKKTPQEMKLILIDPKRLEFSAYADIAHLLFPIVVDPKKAVLVLQWVSRTMEERYQKMAECGVRNIGDYNSAIKKGIKKEQSFEEMPYIVVCIDELSDLMMTAGKEVEIAITRIAQMARAAGIHLIVATQRPSVDVITGLIKVNFPSRISFRVTSRGDSRTILDNCGAERLLGRGDMLFLDATSAVISRVHGAYVSDKEIKEVIDLIKKQESVSYLNLQNELAQFCEKQEPADYDELYQEVLFFVKQNSEISISLLQRKFRIGYNRSARLIERLESQGIIMPQDGSKTRKVLK